MSTERANRPSIVGADDGPEAPFPLRLDGEIIKGFGRGSKELGIPTANIPIDGLTVAGRSDITSGIYFGFAGLHAPADVHSSSSTHAGGVSSGVNGDANATSSAPGTTQSTAANGDAHAIVYPMVMSVGWNPFYQNEKRSVEIHLLPTFSQDFYGAHIRLLILGFVRPELNYVSKDALIEDIRTDIAVTRRSLERPAWKRYAEESWLVDW